VEYSCTNLLYVTQEGSWSCGEGVNSSAYQVQIRYHIVIIYHICAHNNLSLCCMLIVC
jgi:hypothetical protein